MRAEPDATPGDESAEPGWRRLSHRVIWVDLAIAVVSLTPALLGLWLAPSTVAVGVLLFATLLGVGGAVGDALRWASTAYLVTETEIRRRSGIFVRRSRVVRRDRIRSVDTFARLRHRLTGMRVVSIGAGQQSNAREMAFTLDALSHTDAERLREELLGIAPARARTTRSGRADGVTKEDAERPASEPGVDVLERFRLRWVLYNVFTVWAYVMVAGLVWGGYWLLATIGIDLLDVAGGLVDDLDWATGIVIVLVAGGGIGAVTLGSMFVVSNWRFELARVRSSTGSFLRTRRGLFSTREVNRDESRVRGVSIDEPLAWRWMGMADTHVLTTGLSLDSSEEATALVPRGPRSVAHRVAAHVVGDAFESTRILPRHPRAALRRRLVWATGATAGVVSVVALPVILGVVPDWTLWIALAVWPVTIAGACIAYASLGHAIHGEYVITRAGLVHRSTAVLRRDAVSTVVVRQSLLQRRLGLSTVACMTAAGWGEYDAPDVAADEAFAFASDAAPGLLDPFLEVRRAR